MVGAAEAVTKTPEIISFLKNKNKKCILAAGGANLAPLHFVAKDFGTELANFAIQYGFDGVDLDIENLTTPPTQEEINWLVEATKAVKKVNKNLLISHAPQATYFTNNGGYSLVEKGTGGAIDYYNIQYYNQGSWGYQTYSNYDDIFTIMYENQVNETSIPSIIKQGVPANKLMVGKPITIQDLGSPKSTGYIPLEGLTKIINQALENKIPFGGVMGWKIDSDKNGHWGKTMKQTLSNKKVPVKI
ncbi:Glyco_hydro_18 domain-containing protein [Tenacibaculum sp. 190524A02b]|uniref:chitinase n=2 Tax=Tenacibaculum vairaonense TaxID=3137860 RepID=A0ABP1FDK6_9FLAO